MPNGDVKIRNRADAFAVGQGECDTLLNNDGIYGSLACDAVAVQAEHHAVRGLPCFVFGKRHIAGQVVVACGELVKALTLFGSCRPAVIQRLRLRVIGQRLPYRVAVRAVVRAALAANGVDMQVAVGEDDAVAVELLAVGAVAGEGLQVVLCQRVFYAIGNGEIAVLHRMRRTRELYGFRFAEVLLTFPDYGDFELEVNLLLDTLHSDAPALPKADNDRLFYAVLEDYADIPVKRERMKKMKADPHYNALQVKYAYAVTCHKAQGGQWKNVFLDQGYMTDEYLTPDYFRWLYTAFTRATGTLYLVNYPKEQIV